MSYGSAWPLPLTGRPSTRGNHTQFCSQLRGLVVVGGCPDANAVTPRPLQCIPSTQAAWLGVTVSKPAVLRFPRATWHKAFSFPASKNQNQWPDLHNLSIGRKDYVYPCGALERPPIMVGLCEHWAPVHIGARGLGAAFQVFLLAFRMMLGRVV